MTTTPRWVRRAANNSKSGRKEHQRIQARALSWQAEQRAIAELPVKAKTVSSEVPFKGEKRGRAIGFRELPESMELRESERMMHRRLNKAMRKYKKAMKYKESE